jgi:hypothetical protein
LLRNTRKKPKISLKTVRGVIKKFSASPRKHCRTKMILVLFLNILSPDFNTLSLPTLKYSNPFLAEGYILSLQLCFNSMDDIIIVPKMATTKLRF